MVDLFTENFSAISFLVMSPSLQRLMIAKISDSFSLAFRFLSPKECRFLETMSLILSKPVPINKCFGLTQSGLSQ